MYIYHKQRIKEIENMTMLDQTMISSRKDHREVNDYSLTRRNFIKINRTTTT